MENKEKRNYYRQKASEIYGISYEDVTEGQYQFTKAMCFLPLYGNQPLSKKTIKENVIAEWSDVE